MARQNQNRKLHRVTSWKDLNARMIKMMEYPLPVTTFSYDECCEIFYSVLEGGLQAVGTAETCTRRLSMDHSSTKDCGSLHFLLPKELYWMPCQQNES